MSGIVYLVGSGPGGIGLLTIRGREVIESADVILYDQLPGEEIISLLPRSAQLIDCGKYGSQHTLEQHEIEELMVTYARQGQKVVRLKGGDPFLFGRGGEEMETLRKNRIPYEIVPGITSAIAVPEWVGIPVTHRSYASQVTILTGHEDPTKPASALNWQWLAKTTGTIVILMGVRNLPAISTMLLEHGMDRKTPVAIIENGMRPEQRVTVGGLDTIAALARERGVKPPAVIVIGDVVSLYEDTKQDAGT
jgi:uroporphyrin-III C-methyltransferase